MAAIFSIRFMVMTILVVFGISVSDNKKGLGFVSAQMCQVNLQDLISQCSEYVGVLGSKTNPSQQCCDVVNTIDVPCACNFVTKEIEQIVSMEKVVYVAETCGVKLNHGMKCGSYTVP